MISFFLFSIFSLFFVLYKFDKFRFVSFVVIVLSKLSFLLDRFSSSLFFSLSFFTQIFFRLVLILTSFFVLILFNTHTHTKVLGLNLYGFFLFSFRYLLFGWFTQTCTRPLASIFFLFIFLSVVILHRTLFSHKTFLLFSLPKAGILHKRKRFCWHSIAHKALF